MRVEHTLLEPIKGNSGREKTALTMKSIKQLLEEEAAKKTHVPVSPKPTLKGSTAPAVEAEKTVPPMPLPVKPTPVKARRVAVPEPTKAEALPEITPAPEPAPSKARSFLGRLIGG